MMLKNVKLLFLVSLLYFACGEQVIEKEIIVEKEIPAVDPGLMHIVYFWLNEDQTDSDKASFVTGLRSLGEVASVDRQFIGPPANTENRDVVDNSFDYALILWFKDKAAQDAYQIDPIHLKFVEDHQTRWEKVVVRDNVLL